MVSDVSGQQMGICWDMYYVYPLLVSLKSTLHSLIMDKDEQRVYNMIIVNYRVDFVSIECVTPRFSLLPLWLTLWSYVAVIMLMMLGCIACWVIE